MTTSSATYRLGAENWLGTGSLSTSTAGSFATKTSVGTASCAAGGTLYAYLYDVNLLDDGTLISYLPYTYSGATPGSPLHLSAQFLTTSFDIPAGDSVALVIGAKDPLVLDADQSGSTVTFGGPSSLTLPLGN